MWNQSYYSADLPELNIPYTDGDRHTIIIDSLEHENLLTLQEQYHPDANGNIIIRGLQQLVQTYIQPFDITTIPLAEQNFLPAVTLTITVTHADTTTTSYTTTVHYSTIRTAPDNHTPIDPENNSVFLTHSRKVTITHDTPLILSHSAGLSVSVDVTYVYEDNLRTDSISLQPVSGTGITVHYLTLQQLVQLLPDAPAPKDIVTIRATLIDDGAQTDSMMFHVSQHPPRQQTVLLYTNSFGCPEVLTVTGARQTTPDLDTQFAYIDSKYRQASSKLLLQHSLTTQHLTQQQIQHYNDLAVSPRVFVLNQAQLSDEITITDIKYTDPQPRTAPVTLSISYRTANHTHTIFNPTPYLPPKIFDRTFDHSFQ